ncbi:MAG: DNA polymerase III subunit gamma/tau, partial [Fidelibacterota bacterium]
EIDGASNRGIDDIRDLRENAKYPPTSGKYRVYIIDEVHMLTKEAFNALLKTLEEPPPFVVFILATTDPHKIPPTILSRTQKFDFKRIALNDIVKQLEMILKSENLAFDENSLKIIGLKADGGLRDALSMLDQIIAFTDSKIDIETVNSVLGMVQQSVYLELLKNLYKNNKNEVLRLIDNTLSSGIAITDFINGFNDFIRNCMVLSAGGKNIIKVDESTQNWLKANKDQFGTVDLMRILDMSLKFETGLKYLQHPQIGLETLMLKIASMGTTIELSRIIKNVSAAGMDDGIKLKSSDISSKQKVIQQNTEAAKTVSKAGSSKQNVIKATRKSSKLSIDSIRAEWKKVIEHIDTVSNKLSHLLEDSEVISMKDNTIEIQIPSRTNGFKIKNLEKDIGIVEKLLKSYFDQVIKVYFTTINLKDDNQSKKKIKSKGVEEHPLSLYLIEQFEGELIR